MPDALLVDELCVALRDVGVENEALPDLGNVRAKIRRVQQLHAEIANRNLGIDQRIRHLEHETSWPMRELLKRCLGYPNTVPYLNPDAPSSCGNCYDPLRASDALGLCDSCLAQGIAIAQLPAPPGHLNECTICERSERGFVVYAHATQWVNYCSGCLAAENARRRATVAG